MNGANDFITGHPFLVVSTFSALWLLLAALWGALRWFVKREFQKMEKHQGEQDEAIDNLRQDMGQYKLNFAVSQKSFDTLAANLEKHMQQEEETQRVVSAIRQDVAWIKGRMRNGG